MEKTLGEQRVRTGFNPSAQDAVSIVKNEAAKAINMLEDFKNKHENPEAKRLASIAQTKYEEAAMWAVKALTT